MAQIATQTLVNDDDQLCSETAAQVYAVKNCEEEGGGGNCNLGNPNSNNYYLKDGDYLNREARIERAWAHWKKLGQPKLIVAPMVDNSELPFRMLCRKYGAEAAYTPMLHSRLFTENQKYRSQEFTTCKVLVSLY